MWPAFAAEILTAVGLGDDRPEIRASQERAMARQLPLYYLILGTNALSPAWSFFGRAPMVLTVAAPAVLSVVCSARAAIWHRRRKAPPPAPEIALRRLRSTTGFATLFSVLLICWVFALYRYGDETMRLQIAYYTVVTTIGGTLCFVRLPAAAIVLAVVVIIPFTIGFVASGSPILIAAAMHSFMIYMAVLYILVGQFQDFQAMIKSKQDLQEQYREVARLEQMAKEIESRRQGDRQVAVERLASAFTQSVEGVTSTLSDIARQSAGQSRHVAECTGLSLKSLERVVEAADEADLNLVCVAEATKTLCQEIDGIRRRTSEAATIATSVADRTAMADAAMVSFDGTLARIDTIATLIRTIASQIDLIALNATIEAARAGEAGRSFAVVASEIKILAGRTAKATQEIGTNIADVKEAAQAALASVREMKTAFTELRGVSDDIADALDTQTHATDEIHVSVEKAVEGATAMRRDLADMSNAAERTNSSARAMLTQSGLLGAETEKLADEVVRFTGVIRAA